jgi:hypothetical protein
MEQGPLHVGQVAHTIAEQVDSPVVDGFSDVDIACSVGRFPERSLPNPNRGPLLKLSDAVVDFIGYHRQGEPFRNRQRD